MKKRRKYLRRKKPNKSMIFVWFAVGLAATYFILTRINLVDVMNLISNSL